MESGMDSESESEEGVVDSTIMSIMPLYKSDVPKLEIPLAVQNVISRIEQAQLNRAREDINMQLTNILFNVQRIINRYIVDKNVHSGRKTSLVEYKKQRTNFLDKIVTCAKNTEIEEKTLLYILEWLEEWNAILSKMTAIDIEEHHHSIAKMEVLSETFKAIESNVKILSRISISLFEEKKKQNKKITSRGTLWKSWKERVIKRPATALALRPDQMISDEFATNTKVSEIQDMLQELINTAMFNKLENNAIKYISSTIVNLSKALSILNDEVKVFNLSHATMYINETNEKEKEISLKIIQDLSEQNEILQQKLQDAEEKYKQFIWSKGVEHQVCIALPPSTLKVLPELSPQSSVAVSKADIEDSMENILVKELENIMDEAQTKGTKASGIKWDSAFSYMAPVKMTPDLIEQQYPLPEKNQKDSSKGIIEENVSLKEDDVYQKDGTDQYRSQKEKQTKSSYMHETSRSHLSDDEGKERVSQPKLDHHLELQALKKDRKEMKSFSEAKPKSFTESKSHTVLADYPSTDTKSQGGKSGKDSIWERLREVKPEHSHEKSDISSENKEEPTTESMDKESKSEMSSQAEQFWLTQLGYSFEKVKTKGKEDQISPRTTTSKEGKTEEDIIVLAKKVKSHELVKSPSRIVNDASESTRVLENPDGKSGESNLEEFQKSIMAFLEEKIDNTGKPLDEKTVPKRELLLKRAEVEKLEIIKAKMEEYFQIVAETVSKILRKYKNIKNAGQVGEKPMKQKKEVSFMPGLHFQKPISAKAEISTLVSSKSMDPLIDNLIQMILTEIEGEKDAPVASTVGRDHKEKEKQRWEEYLQEGKEKVFDKDLKHHLQDEGSFRKKSCEMINKKLENGESWLQMKERKQRQQKQKQWQEEEIWKEQQKQTEQDDEQTQRKEEEKYQKPKRQQLEAWNQKMKEQEVPLEKEKKQMRPVQKEVRYLRLETNREKEEKQKPKRNVEDHERWKKKPKDQRKIDEKNFEGLEKMFRQTSATLSPRWKSIQKLASQLHRRKEFHGDPKTLETLADGKHPISIAPSPSTQSLSPEASPVSGQSSIKTLTLTQQAQALGITITPQQAEKVGITVAPEQAQALRINLTPQQDQEMSITVTPQKVQALGTTVTPQQAKEQRITLTPQQAHELGSTLTDKQAQAQGITLIPEQAKELGLTLTDEQTQAQGITLFPQQAQAMGITVIPQQGQSQGITLTPEQTYELGFTFTEAQTLPQGITLTPDRAKALSITVTPDKVQEMGITLTPQQAQALGIIVTPEQSQAQGATLTSKQVQALGITLSPEQAQAQGIPLTPQQAQAQGIPLTPQQAQAQGIPLTTQLAQAQGIPLTPQQAQAQGIPLTPQLAQAQGIPLTPQQAQALGITVPPVQAQTQTQGITLTPQQVQTQGIPLTPQLAQAQGIPLTPQQAQALGITVPPVQAQTQTQGITLTPQQVQTQGIPLTPQQAQAQGIPLTPQLAQAQGIPLTPQQAQAQGIPLTPQQAQAQGIPLTPQQVQTQGIPLTPQLAQAQGIPLTPQQAQAQGIPLTPQQAQAQGIPLTPQQVQTQGIPLTPQQAQAQGIPLTPQLAQAQGIPLTPQLAQAQGIPLTPQQAQAQGIPLTPQQAQAQGIPLTPQLAQAQGIPLTPQQAQAQGIPLTPQQVQTQGIPLTPQQVQTQGIPLTPQQAQAQGIPLTPQLAQAQGIPLTPQQVQTQGIPLTPQQTQAQGITLTPEQAQAEGITLTSEQFKALVDTLTPEKCQGLGFIHTPENVHAWGSPLAAVQAWKLGVPITPENAWVSTATLTPEQTQALGTPLSLEQAQALGISLSPEHLWESDKSDKSHALGFPLTLEQVQPLGAPFIPGQSHPMGVDDLKSRAALIDERLSPLGVHPLLEHTLKVGIVPVTDKPVTPSVPHISKQFPTLDSSSLRSFQKLKAPVLPRQSPASAPIAEKSSPIPLQISRSPLSQAPGKLLGVSLPSEPGKLLAPQTFPSSKQTLFSKGQPTSVQSAAPEVPLTPGTLPTSRQPLTLETLLGLQQFFTSWGSWTPQLPQISEDPLAPRQPLISRAPHTSAQIPGLLASPSPRKPFVPGTSSIQGELLEPRPLTLSEQPQASQPGVTCEQSLYLQAPSTLGQHQASPPQIPPTPGHPPTLWASPTPGKPQKDLSSSVSKESKERLAISSLKSKSAFVHPSAADFKVTQAPFTTKKSQISEVSDTSEEIPICHDPIAMEQFRTFQSYLTNYRTPVPQTPYIPTLLKPGTSLPSLTTKLPKTSQISSSEWDQKSQFPPIDKPWILTSVSHTKKPKMMVPPSTPQEFKEQRYFVDVEAQRKNLILLNQATKASGLPSQLHATARNLIIETLHSDTVRLGYLFHKYIAYRLIQRARNNLIRRLQVIQNTGKGYETRNLYIMLSRIDEYQKKVMQVWTNRQKSLETKRNKCLRKMIFLFSQFQQMYKLNLSQPIPLVIDKKQIPTSTKFVQQPCLDLLKEEDRKSDTSKKFRQEDQMEAIWNADLSTSSYPITEKTSIRSLWAQLGGYPDIPMLLQLDVQSTFRKSLGSIKSQSKKIPK